METAVNIDGWEAILGIDADLAAFLSDDDACPADVRLLVPMAANDNWLNDPTEGRRPTPWQPRFRTVE